MKKDISPAFHQCHVIWLRSSAPFAPYPKVNGAPLLPTFSKAHIVTNRRKWHITLDGLPSVLELFYSTVK